MPGSGEDDEITPIFRGENLKERNEMSTVSI
jgi:hypothetical protein